MAQGLFKKYLADRGIDGIEVESAGIGCFAGDAVNENAVAAAKEYGVDISSHRSRVLNDYDFSQTDYFFCMTARHAAYLERFVPREKIYNPVEIEDPYGFDLSVYRDCAAQIYALFDAFLLKIKGVSIKKITASDISLISALEKECFSLPWNETSVQELFDKDSSCSYTARVNDEFAGYILAENICGDINLYRVSVKNEFRRLGIGTALIDRLRSQSADMISLEVRKSNMNAISLYKKLGFTIEGERKDFYEQPVEDAYVMILHFTK